MATRVYGQYCGLARALEVVGERWALLIVRDLLVGPKRFSDLARGLAHIPSNILTARLKELEASGIVRRSIRPRPEGGVTYELTSDGRELEEAVVVLSRWGAKRLGEPRPGEVVTGDSMAMALRTTFRPESREAGDDAAFELHVGEIVVNATVRDGGVVVGRGALPAPDLIVRGGYEVRALMAHEITPAKALKNGLVTITGKRALLDTFVRLFRI